MLSRSLAIAAVFCMSVIIFASLAIGQGAGQHSDLLRRALFAISRGQCPQDLMSPLLKAQCDQQLPVMGQRLSSLGPISRTEFQGVEIGPMGPVEVYRVFFGSGQMIWLISRSLDGKAQVLWSPG